MNDEEYDVIYVPSRTPSPMMSLSANNATTSRSPSPNWIPAYSLSTNASNTADAMQRSSSAPPVAGQSGSLSADRTSQNGIASKRRRTEERPVDEPHVRRVILPDRPNNEYTRPVHRPVVFSEYCNRPVAIVLPIIRPCVRRMSNSSDSSATTDSSVQHLLDYGPSIGRRREILHVPEFSESG